MKANIQDEWEKYESLKLTKAQVGKELNTGLITLSFKQRSKLRERYEEITRLIEAQRKVIERFNTENQLVLT